MRRVLITGASRGIGLEFVKQYIRRGDRVFATCRNPGAAIELQALIAPDGNQLGLYKMDVTDETTIEAAARDIGSRVDGIDLLINNAGIFPRGETPRNLESQTLIDVLRVNTVGPGMVIRHFLDLLTAAAGAKVINLSSHLGSITDRNSGGMHSYCTSKAALNMLTRGMAISLKDENIIMIVITPGWVRTDMGGQQAPVAVQDSVSGMIKVIDKLKPKNSGEFFNWKGKRLDW